MYKVIFKTTDGELIPDDNEFVCEESAITYANAELGRVEGEELVEFIVDEV